jgi:hypothetical protein
MLLGKVNSDIPRLPLVETDLRAAVHEGRLTRVVLRGVTPDGFLVEGTYQPEQGLPVPAVLVTRAGTEKTIKCPDRALACLRRLGVEEFEVDVSSWDPGQAFNPTRESYLSRRRRQNYEAALERIERILADAGEPVSPSPRRRLEAVAGDLRGRAVDEMDLRALTVCWCEVFLARWPVPERAQMALYRFARGAGVQADQLSQRLAEYCSDEFKRRCKNQYLSSLDLGATA